MVVAPDLRDGRPPEEAEPMITTYKNEIRNRADMNRMWKIS